MDLVDNMWCVARFGTILVNLRTFPVGWFLILNDVAPDFSNNENIQFGNLGTKTFRLGFFF